MNKGAVSVFSIFAGLTIGASAARKFEIKKINGIQSMSDKHLALFLMMNQWVKVKQNGKNLACYFEKKGYKRIAVYGISYAGVTLIDELRGTGIQVAYGIDKNADSIYSDVDIVTLNDKLDDVDVIVVSAVTFFDEIKKSLENRINCPIVSLEDILYEV
ncbi:MAG TPA: hypothetical protein DDY31_10095 [Lachnospiraceae bacterium]|nr:hypothetical protein [Lachnospiraceae bacterium]